MMYTHKYFTLNSESKKVFDENGKELRLTGNAYRVLVFLCENKNANITEIGNYLDWAKDYDENNIRQYRYKINSIIGHDVIEYKNNIYSLKGEVKEVEKLEEKDRNTDLLQKDSVKLNDMSKSKKLKFSKVPAIIAIISLLLTFLDWSSYGYYTFMKFIVTGVAIYYAYYLYEVIKKQDFWFWFLVAVAILFNPIIPIYLRDKTLWGAIDVVVIIFLISLIFKFKKK